MPYVGILAMLDTGETFEAMTKQTVGQRCRMAALNIAAEFFWPTTYEVAFLQLGYSQYEFPNCEILKSILQRLYNNRIEDDRASLQTSFQWRSTISFWRLASQVGERLATLR